MTGKLPVADMRGVTVKFDEDGAVYSRRVGPLCERCGFIYDCQKVRYSIERPVLTKDEAVNTCRDFKPILVFVDPKGTERGFNTIRMGGAWAKRLRKGSIVALSDKNSIYGYAQVASVRVDSKENIVGICSTHNHMLLDERMSAQEAASRMEKIIRRCYGNLIWTSNELATVIYLRRLRRAEVERHILRRESEERQTELG